VNELGLSTNKKCVPGLKSCSISLAFTSVLLVQKSEELCFVLMYEIKTTNKLLSLPVGGSKISSSFALGVKELLHCYMFLGLVS